MDVVERAHACTSALQSAVGALATEETWSQIATYLEEVGPQVRRLEHHLERSRALGSAKSLTHLHRVRVALDQVRKTFNEQPAQFGQGEVAGLLRTGIRDALVQHRDRADEAWTRMRDSVLDRAPEGLLRLYRAVPEARDSAEKASALRAEIALATRPPAELSEVQAFKAKVDLLSELLHAVRSVPLPPEVEEFIDQALSGDARWAQLTPNVVGWLDEHRMLQTLRVKIV